MVVFVNVEGDGYANGYVNVTFAFRDANEGLGDISAANRSVNIDALFQILGAFQSQVEVEVFIFAQLQTGQNCPFLSVFCIK